MAEDKDMGGGHSSLLFDFIMKEGWGFDFRALGSGTEGESKIRGETQ